MHEEAAMSAAVVDTANQAGTQIIPKFQFLWLFRSQNALAPLSRWLRTVFQMQSPVNTEEKRVTILCHLKCVVYS